ncbi:MAG: UvrD-helicase domain-containing protein [Chitinispirillaceae bacterium]|nr:UvrD-helicase domain-containing protein [Chitinispirillaceae bacterium]
MIDTESGILGRLVLNSVQRDAVVYDSGPQLVFAGAGTGKTRVLTAKIAWLIDRGIPPLHLFAATFTNKAAREMRIRVERFACRPTGGMWIGTFHSLCARLLRSECRHIGYGSAFSIFDTADRTALLRGVLQRLGIDDRTASPRQILAQISRFKNQCVSADEARGSAVGFCEQELVRIYTVYQQTLCEQQAMDFDDLLMNAVVLLREHHEVLEQYRQRFEYVLVDEYQDTNTAQRYLLQLLAGRHNRIFAVGDDDQSIYGWRGARIENILMFEQHFPATEIFTLEQNYRSTGAILDFANAAIVGNAGRAEKKLWTTMGKGRRVAVTRYRDDRHEAQAIGERIKKACNGKVRRGDIALLFRTNAQSRVFEEAFRKEQIPYVLVGGIGFYERAEIKDCLAYLRLLVNPRDNVSFERVYNVPARGLGGKALETLSQKATEKGASLLETLCASDPQELGSRSKKGFSELREFFELLRDEAGEGTSPHELLKEVLQLSGYMDLLADQHTEEAAGRIENINELLNALAIWARENPDGSLAAFLEEVSLASDVDTWEQREDAVNLMTLHCAKGLEFGRVFLVGLEEGLLPSRQNFDDEMKIEEERRLLYVGATRAKEQLFCSYVDRRYRFGELLPQSPSRFLQAIDPSMYDADDQTGNFGAVPPREPAARVAGREAVRFTRADIPVRKIRQKQFSADDDFSQDVVEYRMGQQVRHRNYGRGRIISISGFGSDMKVMVLFNDGTRRKLMAKFANFEQE